jgi:hypothetical protein
MTHPGKIHNAFFLVVIFALHRDQRNHAILEVYFHLFVWLEIPQLQDMRGDRDLSLGTYGGYCHDLILLSRK